MRAGSIRCSRNFPSELRPVPLERDGDRDAQVRGLVSPGGERLLVPGGRGTRVDGPRDDDASRGVRGLVVRRAPKASRPHPGRRALPLRYVEGRLRELGASPAEAAVLEEELAALLPETLCWFGPPGERGLELLVAAGIVVPAERRAAGEIPGRTTRADRASGPAPSRDRRAAVGAMEQPGAPAEGRADAGDGVACPWCGSVEVERLGEFGPGLMTEQWICLVCKSPFEWIRKR